MFWLHLIQLKHVTITPPIILLSNNLYYYLSQFIMCIYAIYFSLRLFTLYLSILVCPSDFLIFASYGHWESLQKKFQLPILNSSQEIHVSMKVKRARYFKLQSSFAINNKLYVNFTIEYTNKRTINSYPICVTQSVVNYFSNVSMFLPYSKVFQ